MLCGRRGGDLVEWHELYRSGQLGLRQWCGIYPWQFNICSGGVVEELNEMVMTTDTALSANEANRT